MTISKDVAITGIGVISSLGVGKEQFWNALLRGATGIGPTSLFDTQPEQSRLAAEVGGLVERFKRQFEKENADNTDRATMLALLATHLALEDAGIEHHYPDDIGVVLGTEFGSLHSISRFDRLTLEEDPNYVSPLGFPNTVINSPASRVAIHYQMVGPNVTISTGAIAGAQALGYASELISSGSCEMVLAGGIEELCEEVYRGFSRLGLLSRGQGDVLEGCYPHDRRRNGLVLGEGGGVLVLEAEDKALARGRRAYARIAGYRTAFDSDGSPVDSIKRSMAQVLEDANVRVDAVDLISSSANGSKTGDGYEMDAVRSIFLDAAKPVPLTSIKGASGECLGCSSALQTAVAALAISESVIPGSAGFSETDSECKGVYLSTGSTFRPVRVALVSSFECDGTSAALLLERCPAERAWWSMRDGKRRPAAVGSGSFGSGSSKESSLRCQLVESENMENIASDNIQNTVVELTRTVLKIGDAAFDLDANLIKDLNVDSLLALELIAKIEKTFRIEIPEERVMELNSTRKLIEITQELTKANAER